MTPKTVAELERIRRISIEDVTIDGEAKEVAAA
jgi:hypothetical protein